MNSKYTGEASILAIIMMVFGVAILTMNQVSLKSRKNYTTVTGKSGQLSKINLGKMGKYVIGIVMIAATFFTSIFPNSFLCTGNLSSEPGRLQLFIYKKFKQPDNKMVADQ